MAYIPKRARWYIANLVQQISVNGQSMTAVHINTVLVRASSPEMAYKRALLLGRSSEVEYENSNGQLVKIKYLGLEDLLVVYDELKHGAELFYQEKIDVPPKDVRKLIKRKNELAIFHPIKASPLNYAAR